MTEQMAEGNVDKTEKATSGVYYTIARTGKAMSCYFRDSLFSQDVRRRQYLAVFYRIGCGGWWSAVVYYKGETIGL